MDNKTTRRFFSADKKHEIVNFLLRFPCAVVEILKAAINYSNARSARIQRVPTVKFTSFSAEKVFQLWRGVHDSSSKSFKNKSL